MENKQQGIRINPEIIKNAKLFECDCGGAKFREGIMFKIISPILSPTGKEEIFPMNVIVCDTCGKIPSYFNPENIIPKEYLAIKNENPKKERMKLKQKITLSEVDSKKVKSSGEIKPKNKN